MACSVEIASWHRFETAKIPEIAFRALLTQGGARQLELVRAKAISELPCVLKRSVPLSRLRIQLQPRW
jgi:hypothetical protein